MKQLALFFESYTGQRVKNMIIGIGAAVVMMGALFKLQSWPGASPMLIAGLSVEAFIFFLQGILPPHKNYHWEKMYPGIDISPELEEGGPDVKPTVTEQLDEMLENANVETALIERLGRSLEKLGETAEKLGETADASIATTEYAERTKAASAALGEMQVAYSTATVAIQGLSSSTEEFKGYQEQVQEVAKNLASLNSLYEVELQDTTSNLRALNQNLSGLNNVYGNMLSAMGGNQGGGAGNPQ